MCGLNIILENLSLYAPIQFNRNSKINRIALYDQQINWNIENFCKKSLKINSFMENSIK